MKKLYLLLAVVLLMASCQPEKKGFEIPEPEDIVMYQVNPRVFAAEKSLNAVAARIDSIADLGINTIWIMPIYPIGVEKGKNSPYCISNYTAIAPEFGTLEDFKLLVSLAHERNIGVILDWVANHTAWDHPWVKQHPEWYTHDEKADTIIHPRPFDWYDVADLNYDNQDMRRAMIDAMRFWIEQCNIDGFRCDVADGVPADFWKDAIDELRKCAGRRILMLAEGKRPDNFTVGGFDMNYGWDFKDSLVSVVANGHPAKNLFTADLLEYDSLPEGKVKMRFTTNHDHAVNISPVKEFISGFGSVAAWVAATFLHGGAMIYGSQEVGYPDTINFFHYVPVDWSANSNLYKQYKQLIKIYNEHPAFRRGTRLVYPNKDILVFERLLDEEDYLVIVSLRNEDLGVSIPNTWEFAKTLDLYENQEIQLTKSMQLQPFQYYILKRLPDTPKK